MSPNGLLHWGVLALAATSAGCAQNYNVRTNKDPAYLVPLKRVLLVSMQPAIATQPTVTNAVDKFEQAIVEAMQRHLDAACIPTASVRTSGAARENAVREAITTFSPTQVLELSLHSLGYVERYQMKMPQGGWKLALRDIGQDRVVWRAEASEAPLYGKHSGALADEFAQKLRSEGFLTDSCRG
jgi:hypothetical protein